MKKIPASLLKALLAAVLLIAAAVGGAQGWKWLQYRQSPHHAAAKLKNALREQRMPELAALVDFRTLAGDLAVWIYAERPQTPRLGKNDAESQTLMSEEVQRSLLAALTQVSAPDEKPAPPAPHAPLPYWPEDLASQLGATLQLQATRDNTAILKAEVKYPLVDRTLAPLLAMEKLPAGPWTVKRVFNAQEMVRQFVDAENALQRHWEEALAKTNNAETQKMNAQLAISSCTATTRMISDAAYFMLVVEIMGYNKGDQTIHNMNIVVDIPAKGTETRRRRLNMARRILPGENFSNTWRLELEADGADSPPLPLSSALQCAAQPQAMTLGNGNVLYLRDKLPPPPPSAPAPPSAGH